ncbi:MAG: Holliday junction DNA helicase RuvB C-terminal domain-containing protein [Candidatus Omnitrophota bacterium]
MLKAGFLKRTKRGREATETAYRHLNLKQAPGKDKGLF